MISKTLDRMRVEYDELNSRRNRLLIHFEECKNPTLKDLQSKQLVAMNEYGIALYEQIKILEKETN